MISYNWNIVESGVQHDNPNPINIDQIYHKRSILQLRLSNIESSMLNWLKKKCATIGEQMGVWSMLLYCLLQCKCKEDNKTRL
jgi:hypothetical protein